jgi:eukaryotic-like serine/threonine-protein kinase
MPPSSAALDVAPELPLPRKLRRMTLLKLIARGGMGEVFLATIGGIEGAERPCVVKLIRREHVKDPSFVARFLDEARVQSQLQHAGVAQVLEADMDDDQQPYVVVEHVEGRSLAEVRARAIQNGAKIGWAESVAIGVSIAESLAYVHERVDERGHPLLIAHRDLSPQNVMIGFTGETKLIDFGTARGQNRRSRTVAGVVYAKPGYVAPEVANGIPGDALVDVYALGVMLWELSSGKRFLDGDPSEHMAAVGQNRRALPSLTQHGAPVAFDQVLARMTAHDKSQRATAREALGDLVRLLAAAPPLASGERGVRPRIAGLLLGLFPNEPKRSRLEFQRLVLDARARLSSPSIIIEHSPAPAIAEGDPDMLPGTRYRIVRRLSEGAGGEVFEAMHLDLSRRAAVKVLPKERSTSEDDAARFRTEACALSRLAHAGLTRLYDYGSTTDGRLYFAMEYLEGETVERLLGRERSLAVGEALRITREAASALAAAHAAGLVHRDIKPSNLLITPDGRVKVLDFGVACVTGDDGQRKEGGLSLFGTPEYMAPEQIDGAVDGRADVYALGSVLYELLTGRLPFAGSSVAILDLKRKMMPESPSDRAASRKLPRWLDALVLKALATKPENRFHDAADFARAIEEAEGLDLRGRGRRRTAGRVAALAVMLGAMVVMGAGARARHPEIAGRLASSFTTKTMELRDAAIRRLSPKPLVISETPESMVASEPAATTEPASAPPEPASPEPVAEAHEAVAALAADEPRLAAEEPVAAPKPAVIEDPATRAIADRAKKAASKKRWRVAKKHAEEWAKRSPTTEARLVLARALAYTGRAADAEKVLAVVLEAEPACDEARDLAEELAKRPAGKAHRERRVASVKGR